jgi:transposase
MEPPPLDHDCPLVPVVADLSAKLKAALERIEKLERQRYGKKSEKMPPPATELRKAETPQEAEARRLAALETRQERAALKKQVEAESIRHAVPDEAKGCPKCGGTVDRPVGDGKTTTEYEYLPGRFKRIEHTQEKLACACGKYIATAPAPPRALDKSPYGPGFIAHLVTMKCADAIPLHRLARQYQRVGIPMSRSTLNDHFHATAIKLTALSHRLLQVIAESRIVLADETPLVMQRPNRRGYVWTFIAGKLIAYRFSASRSGKTAAAVLGGTSGTLVVDAYTGYNRVTQPDGRDRAGCNAHARRGFFEALSSAPIEARKALDLFLEIYRVEHEVKVRGIVRSPEHAALRQTRSRDAMERLRTWLIEEQPRHPPKSPLGEAISYTLNQWKYLTRFLDDVELPVDNNQSEGALRIVALGRKNFLFVGDEESGEHLAGLYSLVSTCEANGVDPIAYLRDVLMRVDTHPASRIDELLPHRWVAAAA